MTVSRSAEVPAAIAHLSAFSHAFIVSRYSAFTAGATSVRAMSSAQLPSMRIFCTYSSLAISSRDASSRALNTPAFSNISTFSLRENALSASGVVAALGSPRLAASVSQSDL